MAERERIPEISNYILPLKTSKEESQIFPKSSEKIIYSDSLSKKEDKFFILNKINNKFFFNDSLNKKLDFTYTPNSLSSIFNIPPLKPLISWHPLEKYTPSPDDYGYVYLRRETDRRQLLEEMVRITAGMVENDINVLVICDRGARPLATLVGQLWGALGDGELPRFFFINTDPKFKYSVDATDIPEDTMDEVRKWLQEEYPDGPNPFRDGGAKVCVLDENKSTGKSANFVANIVRRAFPLQISSLYCEWAYCNGASMPWRNRPTVIGSDTVPGKFKSVELATEQAELLRKDLIKLAQTYQQAEALGTQGQALRG